MYKRKVEVHSCNYCCSGKAMSVTYCECAFVALGIHHVMCMFHIVISGFTPLYNILPQYLKTSRFSKKNVPEHKLCVLISSTAFV
jgi:hypothetical protein